MGTVKYTGSVASFHCPTDAEIRSLKVHFSPKQLGSGDPSPENVREIVGWDGVEVQQTGKNLFDINGNTSLIYEGIAIQNNRIVISSIGSGATSRVYFSTLYEPGTYTFSGKFSGDIENIRVFSPKPFTGGTYNAYYGGYFKVLSNGLATIIMTEQFTIGVIASGVAKGQGAVYDLQFELGSTATHYEPYYGRTIDYEFGVLGKNKFNWDVEQGHASPVTSDYQTPRSYPLNTYIVGISAQNYYRNNYANWVLEPSIDNGVISFSSGSANGYGIGFPLKLKPNQTYFLSGTSSKSSGLASVSYYDKDGVLISTQTNRLNRTITVPNNTDISMIIFYAGASNTSYSFSNIQLELGSTATSYEPYDPKHTVYGGWVDLISGEVCEEWNMLHFSEIENSNAMSVINYVDGANAFFLTIPNKKIYPSRTTPLYCSTFIPITDGRSKQELLKNEITGTSASGVLVTHDTQETNVWNEFTTAYNDPTFTYELATPITYSLSPAQLQTFLGHNNVWSNADYIEVEYDLHETQDILARKQFIIASQPHIETASGDIVSFSTDISAPLKECKIHFSPVQEGTGDPSPSNVRAINGWDAIDVQHQWYELPSEYQAIEYLQTDGKKYVKTGVVPFTGIGFKCKFLTNNYFGGGSYGCIFGGRYNSAIADFQITTYVGAQMGSFRNGTSVTLSAGLQRYVAQTISYINGQYTNSFGETYQYAEYDWDNDDRSREIYIFGLNSPANGGFTQSGSGCRVYYLTIYKDDYVYRNFVPCYNKSTLEHGMFETVTQTFHGMQNTSGSETLGEDISGTTTSITLPSTFYGGYIDLVNGEVVQTYKKYKVSDFTWAKSSRGSLFYVDLTNIDKLDTIYSISDTYAFVYRITTLTQLDDLTIGTYGYYDNSIAYGRPAIRDDRFSTVEAFTENMKDVEIVCQLKIPIHYTLSPETIRTLRGQNNIWSNANGNIEIQYWRR